jgi:hypothetical protein
VELNAFATMERPEIAISRRGAARIAGEESLRKGVQPPPRLNVDLSALINRIGAALILAGISPSAMAAELDALRAPYSRQLFPKTPSEEGQIVGGTRPDCTEPL